MPSPSPPTPRVTRRPRLALAALLVGLLGLVAACTDPEPITAPPPAPPGPPAPEPAAFVNFVPPDYRNVPLAPVPEGKPPKVPPVEVYGGQASLQGRLTYNGEPVGGATVQVERFVGLNSTTVQVSSRDDGAFAAVNIKGGRYRIRAFRGDELTLPEASTVFLAEKEKRDLPLTMIEVPRTTRTVVRATSQPPSPPVGREVMLHFTVKNQTVAPDGSVEKEEFVADRPVKVTSSPNWKINGGSGTTGSNGTVSFTATCQEDGRHEATVELGWITQKVALPTCGQVQKPAPSEPAVGDTVKIPAEGPVPAGTYVTSSSGCQTTYQLWVTGDWAEKRKTAKGKTMTLPNVARDLRPAEGTNGCTYERTA